jgi:hypothetical protein
MTTVRLSHTSRHENRTRTVPGHPGRPCLGIRRLGARIPWGARSSETLSVMVAGRRYSWTGRAASGGSILSAFKGVGHFGAGSAPHEPRASGSAKGGRSNRQRPASWGELIETGKILGWGQSHATEAQIRAAHAITPLTTIQSEFSNLASASFRSARWPVAFCPGRSRPRTPSPAMTSGASSPASTRTTSGPISRWWIY